LAGFTLGKIAGSDIAVDWEQHLTSFLSPWLSQEGLNPSEVCMSQALMPQEKFFLRASEVEVSGEKYRWFRRRAWVLGLFAIGYVEHMENGGSFILLFAHCLSEH
jgi:hypothetical protein